jgi:NAD(P)-dependent dehydrogenase (short-subunit alcohol dehydrogenase family)
MTVLTGKSIVVTGAGRGIGEACAKGIALAGGAVVVNDLTAANAERVAAEIRAAGGKAVAHMADISDWTQAERLIDRCHNEFGRIDGLVNNAGLLLMNRVQNATAAEIEAMVRVNLMGTIFTTVHALRHMVAEKAGAIVNVSSGAQMGLAGRGIYGATKGGVSSFTYACAIEAAADNIRVNAISPFAQTAMLDASIAFGRSEGWSPRPEGPPPESNVPLTVFLLSDLAEGITGQVVRVTGNDLCLITHPAQLHPVVTKPSWTVADVDDAFRTAFRAQLQPLGIVTVRTEAV